MRAKILLEMVIDVSDEANHIMSVIRPATLAVADQNGSAQELAVILNRDLAHFRVRFDPRLKPERQGDMCPETGWITLYYQPSCLWADAFLEWVEPVLLHELVHRHEWEATGGRLPDSGWLEGAPYFSNQSEIRAFARSIVIELYLGGYDAAEIRRLIANPVENASLAGDVSVAFREYAKHFSPGHPVLRQLFANMEEYLESDLERGLRR